MDVSLIHKLDSFKYRYRAFYVSTNDSWSDDLSFVDTKTSRMPFRGVTMLKKPKINHKRRFVLRICHGPL